MVQSHNKALTVKQPLIVFLGTLLATYAIAFTKDVTLFCIFLTSATCVACFFVYFVFLKSVWKIFSPHIEKIYEKRKESVWVAIVLGFFLFLSGWAILSCFVQDKILKFLGILVVVFFSIWLPDIILSPDKKKIAKFASSAVAFALFMFFFKSGRMHVSNTVVASSEEQLRSLPYLTWVTAKESAQYSGVIRYEQGHAYKGINIYNPRSSTRVQLTDMQGNVLHSWSPDIKENKEGFHHVQMDKDGCIFAIVKEKYVVSFDWNSKIRWRIKERAHHDIALAAKTDIYLLSRKDEIVWTHNLPIPVLNDYIQVYSKEGRKIKEISIYKALKSEVPFRVLFKSLLNVVWPENFFVKVKNKLTGKGNSHWFDEGSVQDIMHTNSIQVIDKKIPRLCKKNDILISSCYLNLIAIIDGAREKAIWSWGPGKLINQHHATLLEDSNILIFDNGATNRRKYSRIIELNPLTGHIVWKYRSNPPNKFFSVSRGACQRLPNGNTLITNSDSGYVFEITKSGEIVWEFYSPDIDVLKKKRAAIYRFIRIVNSSEYPILATLK